MRPAAPRGARAAGRRDRGPCLCDHGCGLSQPGQRPGGRPAGRPPASGVAACASPGPPPQVGPPRPCANTGPPRTACPSSAGHTTPPWRVRKRSMLRLRPMRTRGRPRVKGHILASPPAVVVNTATRTNLRGAWSEGTTRDLEVVTGPGPWVRLGAARVAVRGGYVHDVPGPHRDESCLTTTPTMTPPQLGAGYTPRGAIETTCQACRADLPRESTKNSGPHTVRRFTPGGFGRSPTVVRRSRQLPGPSSPRRAVFCRGQSTVTCAERMICVRRA
jgi:hypothetical protein